MQRARAQGAAETRRRIVEAALSLHTTVGPRATTISDIAARAGVERPTVYRHFPSEKRLLAACTSHFAVLHPLPEALTRGPAGTPGRRRVEAVLRALYAHYDEVGDLLTPIARDQQADPGRLGSAMTDQLRQLRDALVHGWVVARPHRASLKATVALALSLWTWRALVREQGLSSADAARLMADLVTRAARPTSR